MPPYFIIEIVLKHDSAIKIVFVPFSYYPLVLWERLETIILTDGKLNIAPHEWFTETVFGIVKCIVSHAQSGTHSWLLFSSHVF